MKKIILVACSSLVLILIGFASLKTVILKRSYSIYIGQSLEGIYEDGQGSQIKIQNGQLIKSGSFQPFTDLPSSKVRTLLREFYTEPYQITSIQRNLVVTKSLERENYGELRNFSYSLKENVITISDVFLQNKSKSKKLKLEREKFINGRLNIASAAANDYTGETIEFRSDGKYRIGWMRNGEMDLSVFKLYSSDSTLLRDFNGSEKNIFYSNGRLKRQVRGNLKLDGDSSFWSENGERLMYVSWMIGGGKFGLYYNHKDGNNIEEYYFPAGNLMEFDLGKLKFGTDYDLYEWYNKNYTEAP